MDIGNFINKIYTGDSLCELKKIPSESCDMSVTSPPYLGLRDYGTVQWVGGNLDCTHMIKKDVCPICGAVRIDNQIGLEKTPESYIARLVEVFMEVYRILKPTGTLWLNIGDSYWGGKGYSGSSAGIYQYERIKEGKSITPACSNFGGKGTIRATDHKHEYIKPKDLIGIPWMLALELRRAGFYLRQDIIWHKPNPMPESVKDRCTRSHEYIFLLTKSANYYFDSEAIREPQSELALERYKHNQKRRKPETERYLKSEHRHFFAENVILGNGRNKRDVWSVLPDRTSENHFATFPQKLIVDCIKAGCSETGIVLDPFMGSGTTAVVARKLNRNYIGIELNPEYVEIANRRLNRELGFYK